MRQISYHVTRDGRLRGEVVRRGDVISVEPGNTAHPVVLIRALPEDYRALVDAEASGLLSRAPDAPSARPAGSPGPRGGRRGAPPAPERAG